METDPPRFLYLKDEILNNLKGDPLEIQHPKFENKSVALTSRSVRRWGGGVEQRNILDQYLTSGIVSTRSIQRFKKYPILKTFNQ